MAVIEKAQIDPDTHVCFFDFESDPTSYTEKHKPVMVCFLDWKTKEFKTFIGLDCHKQLINHLSNNYKNKKVIAYAHNCAYDISFLIELLKFTEDSFLMKDGQFYRCQAKTYKGNVSLEFRDSYKILPMKLSEIPAFLKLPTEKEAYDYDLNRAEIFFKKVVQYDQVNPKVCDQIKVNC